jgi:hypothetical protein
MMLSSAPPAVLVLFARYTTQRALDKEVLVALHRFDLNSGVQYVSYEQLARMPAHVAGQRLAIVLCDLEYTGAGQPVCHHLNAAFERLSPERSALLVWQPPSGSGSTTGVLVDETAARAQLRNIFFANNAKSDRYEAQPHKCTLIHQQVAKHLDDERLRTLL